MNVQSLTKKILRALMLAGSVLAGVPIAKAAAPVPQNPACYTRQDLSARTSGFLAGVLVHDGQDVKTGDVIAKLDDRMNAAAVREAKAAVAAAGANLDLAKDTQQRLAKLTGTVAPQELFDADIRVRQAAAQLEQANAALDKAKAALDDTRIKAEIDGRVSGLPQVKGLFVQAGHPLGRVEAAASTCAASR